MIVAYRLCSRRYPANSGRGAAIYGGRWNRVGTEAIYTAQSPSLAALEILVHYDVLPRNFVMTPIQIPDTVDVLRLESRDLPARWYAEAIHAATQDIGSRWLREGKSAVLSVPSSVVRAERNFILNPAHPDFSLIRFLRSAPFRFDSRLKKTKN